MSERVDLDHAWELSKGCAGDFDVDGCEFMRAVITELRAARRVIDVERPLSRPHCSHDCSCERNRAWVAYDKSIGGATGVHTSSEGSDP